MRMPSSKEWTVQDDVLAGIWACQLPVRVCVAPDSNTSPTALPPFYVLVPRQACLSSISSQLWHMIQHVLPKVPGSTQPRAWFDFKGIALKSTLPVGVLFDLLAASEPPSWSPVDSQRRVTDTSGQAGDMQGPGSVHGLPWPLTIHYTHAPPETSASWLASLPPHTQFLNSLKEACHICKGTDGSAAVMRMEGAAQDALWAAVEKGDLGAYQPLLASLKVIPSPRSQGASPPAIPLRLLLRNHQASPPKGGPSTVWDHISSTSRPVPAIHPGGQWVTLWEALHAILPSLFPPPPPLQATESSSEPCGLSGKEAPLQSDQKPAGEALEASHGTGHGNELADAQPPDASTHTPEPPPSADVGRVAEDAPKQDAGQGQSTEGDQGAGMAAGPSQSQDLTQSGMDMAASSVMGAGADGGVGAAPVTSPGPGKTKEWQLAIPLNRGASQAPQGYHGLAVQAADSSQAGVGCSWFVCGVQPPLDTPLAWLHAHMHAPDYFLYVVIHAPPAPTGDHTESQGTT